MKEYVELHYPVNPAVPLTAFTENGLKPVRLEVKIVARKAEWYLEKLENPHVGEKFKSDIRKKALRKLLVKLSRFNLRLRDKEVSDLVARGEMECFGEECA